MRFMSLCAGIEAASVAWSPLGFKCIGLAEIEAFPSAVTAHHYPDVPNFGDIARFETWPDDAFAKADIIVGGPPCQAFSISGLRKGLNDDRGNLTLTYVKIIDHADRIRKQHQLPPVISLYENVPGLLSDKTGAFGSLLAGLAGEDVQLESPGKRWTDAGCVSGPKRTVAWRTLDAQFFQLAQRRRRVFVVASARERFDPAAVLLEFEGLRRDTPPRRETRKDAAADTSPGAEQRRSHWDGDEHPHPTLNQSFNTGAIGYSNQELFSQRGAGIVGDVTTARMVALGEYASDDTASTLKSRDYKDATDLVTQPSTGSVSHCLNAGGMLRQDFETETLITHALRAGGFDASEDGTGRGTPLVPVHAFYSTESRCDHFPPPDISPPLKVGSNGGGQPPAIAFSAKDHGGDATEDLSPTLRAMPHQESHANGGGQMAVAMPILEVGKRTGISTDDPRAGLGIGKEGDPMYTLQAGAQHGVAYPLDLRNAVRNPDKHDAVNRQGLGLGADGDPAPTISTAFVPGVAAYAFQPRIARNGRGDMGDLVNALNAQSGETGKGDAAPCVAVADTLGVGGNQTSGFKSEVVAASMAVRRLTPEECESLQGFPQGYTRIPWKMKAAGDCPDGPRYRALGNSMAVNVMRWIGERIKASAAAHDGDPA